MHEKGDLYTRSIASLILTLAVPLCIRASDPTTPIKHLVVIFNENNWFDHYFATYPNAANLPGEQTFAALPNTPSVHGLSGVLLTNKVNSTKPLQGNQD